MGCGESKHVATGNTISRKSSRAGSRRGKTSEAIEEETRKIDGTTSSSVQDEGKNVNQDSGAAGNSGAVMVDGKDNAESPELTSKTMAEETNEKSVQEIKLVEDSKDETKEAAMEDKKLDEIAREETVKDQKTDEEKKEETASGEPEIAKEESLVKESETAETTEAEVSTPVEKQEEKPVVSPAVEDMKTE